jgi:uncharacterized membrane protein HdeD (DUF308 family)
MTDSANTAVPPGPGAAALRTEAMSGLLARNWWAVLLRGIAAILFGLAALLAPGLTLASLVLLFAAYMLVDGVFAIVSAIRAARRQERWALFVLEGVVDLVAGAAVFLLPGAALLAFVALLAIWALISGGLMVASAFRLHRDHGRIWLIVGGVASVVWGALLLVYPITGLVVMTWYIGAYALVFGVSLIVLGVTLRSRAAGHAAGPAHPAQPA